MLATHPPSFSLHPHRSLACSRPALADSTNAEPRSHVCASGYPKSKAYLTSSSYPARARCSDAASALALPHPRHPHHSSHLHAHTPFQLTRKAPPTVSISLSAACSQSIPGGRCRGSRVQGSEPDLPDVISVVPFPSGSRDSDTDVDMLDGTCTPIPEAAPRKRRSAHSSIVSQSAHGSKDVKPKRPRKSKRQVAELWWLGVIQRSIIRFIEARQAVTMPDISCSNASHCYFDAMDRVLVERIQRRLVENGCGEGRALPNPLPRISSPSISVPSVNISEPSRKMLPADPTADLLVSSPSGSSAPAGIIVASSSIPSAPTLSQQKRHVRFDISQPPPHSRVSRHVSHPTSVPRRSPSPPARTSTMATAANAPTLTLTMPQLVASLMFAYRERKSVRVRGRSSRVPVAECGTNAGHSAMPPECRGDAHLSRARLWSATPDKRSPLSQVAYVES